jgi:hypothetical protein
VTNFLTGRLRRHDDAERRWPGYLFGGHVRTSTAVLVLAFAALWFVYNDHQDFLKSTTKPTPAPASQTVPAGFSPDPNYFTCTNDTCVPRTHVLRQPTAPSVTSTPTEPPTPTTTTTTTTPPPLFPGLPPLPTLPPLPPPWGPPATTTAPPPGAAPTPTPAPAPPAPGVPGSP